MTPMLILIALLGAHYYIDFDCQGYVAFTKNRIKPQEHTPWYQAMTAHCAMHGAAVALITGIWWLFIAEFVIHFITDDIRCQKKISYNTDQAVHIVCKFFWWFITIRMAYTGS